MGQIELVFWELRKEESDDRYDEGIIKKTGMGNDRKRKLKLTWSDE